jgi:RND family efflux transporter MFP subunit
MKINLRAAKRNVGFLVIVLQLVTVISGCSSKAAAPKPGPVTNIRTVKAALSNISTTVEYPSKLSPIKEVTVSPKAGEVKQVFADVGDSVRAGEVLLTLDSSAAGEKVEVNYNNALENYKKMQQLFESGAISSQNLQDAETLLKNAEIDLKHIDNTVTSPISGIISFKDVDVGDTVSGMETVFKIIDAGALVAEVGVPDSMVVKLRKGQKVPVIVDVVKDKTIEGTIDSISPTADSSQTFIVKIKLNTKKSAFRPGMFARVTFPAKHKENILTVP